MKPQLFSSGNPTYLQAVRVCTSTFNGAAAFQPRKSSECGVIEPKRISFNEAAAFQPRKCGRQKLNRLVVGPSMEPQLFSRGNAFAPTSGNRSNAAFNEAAAFQPRKSMKCPSCNCIFAAFNEAAAFQPRKFCGASLPAPRSPTFNEAAAFQPRKWWRSQR